MGEVTNQIAIVLGVLAACFAGPAAARFVLIRRESKARQNRRFPIGIAVACDQGSIPVAWQLSPSKVTGQRPLRSPAAHPTGKHRSAAEPEVERPLKGAGREPLGQ